MKRKSFWRILIAVLVAASTVLVAGPVAAQDSEDKSETARETGPIVRHKLLYRSTRVELTPMLGMTVNDAFLRNGVVGAQVAYHLTNEFGIAFTGGYSPIQLKTDLYNNVEAELQENNAGLEDTSFSYIQWMAGLEVQYVPIFGKFSLVNSLISNYDLHLILGISAMGQNAQPAVEGEDTDPQLSGISPSPMFGLGFRLFTSDALAITVQARDYLYSRAVISQGTANTELRNNIFVSVGASFFFPGEVKISR
ncbi:MAG: outer membrane beta-barrel domain-containing protein [Myxococcota bacterium]